MIPCTTVQNTSLGRLIYENGDVYEGPWTSVWIGKKMYHHIPHGQGVKQLQDGKVLEGNFVLGTLSQGYCLYPDGSMYIGKFWQNNPEGQGTFYYQSICTCRGRFQTGVFTQGTIQWIDPKMKGLPALIDHVAQDLQTNDLREIVERVKQICLELGKAKRSSNL